MYTQCKLKLILNTDEYKNLDHPESGHHRSKN